MNDQSINPSKRFVEGFRCDNYGVEEMVVRKKKVSGR